MTLNIKEIKRLTKLSYPKRKSFHDKDGLYLKVKGPKNAAWVLKYERQGKGRELALGSLRNFTLDEARERARRARQLLSDGVDPASAKQDAKRQRRLEEIRQDASKVTFEQAATEYFNAHERKWKNDVHRAQFLSSLRLHAFPLIGRLTVSDIDKDLVMQVLTPIWQDKPETANRVRGRIETILNYCNVRNWRDAAVPNPARWRGHLDVLLLAKSHIRKVVHHRALPYSDLPAFMRSLRGKNGVAARGLEFLVLTAARTAEITGAVWSEIDLDEGTWTVSGERMKSGRPHRVPLAKQAIALLKNLPREDGNPYLFIGPRRDGLSNAAMDATMKRLGMKTVATVHGFRSTFRDWAAETSDFPSDVAEAALAHVTGDKTELAYKRSDLLLKRRRLMQQWADFTFKTPTPIVSIQEKITKQSARSK